MTRREKLNYPKNTKNSMRNMPKNGNMFNFTATLFATILTITGFWFATDFRNSTKKEIQPENSENSSSSNLVKVSNFSIDYSDTKP